MVQEEDSVDDLSGVPSETIVDYVAIISTKIHVDPPATAYQGVCVQDPAPTRLINVWDSPARSSHAPPSGHGYLSQQGLIVEPVGSAVEPTTGDDRVVHRNGVETRSKSGISKPKIYINGTIQYSLSTSIGKPQRLDESFGDKNWRKAMDAEYEAL
jgi:hypothetical protein